MGVDERGAELDELGLHRVVHTGGETLVVRTGALERTLLVEVVEAYIISIMGTTTAQVHVVVLADTSLEHLVKPVGVGSVDKVVTTVIAQAVTAGKRSTRVGTSLTQIVAVLVGIHHIVCAARNEVHTEITLVVHLQRLVFLTVLRGDDDHTVSGT